ncbi:hypothetical protein RI054_19g87410 [Pseudoscourfieldia marina]
MLGSSWVHSSTPQLSADQTYHQLCERCRTYEYVMSKPPSNFEACKQEACTAISLMVNSTEMKEVIKKMRRVTAHLRRSNTGWMSFKTLLANAGLPQPAA